MTPVDVRAAGRARTIGTLWREAAARGGTAFHRQTREGWEPVGWEEAAERVDALAAGDPRERAEARAAEVAEGDVLTYLYTSGTTGTPKACVLTHRNFTAMTDAVCRMNLVGPGDSLLLFLPLGHNFARLMQYTGIHEGVPVIYCRDFIAVPKALKETRPTVVPGVP